MEFSKNTDNQNHFNHNILLLMGIVIVSILIAVSLYIGYTMFQSQMLAMEVERVDIETSNMIELRVDENVNEIDSLQFEEGQQLTVEQKLQILQAEDPTEYLSPDPDSEGNIVVESENFTLEEKKRFLIASQEADAQQVEVLEQEASPEQMQ